MVKNELRLTSAIHVRLIRKHLRNIPSYPCSATQSQFMRRTSEFERLAKTLLHSRFNGDWKKENGGYQTHLDPIWRLERAQQTTIFRLRTGHCGLSAHLKRTGISDTSLCECGQADQTPDQVLQSCPKYAERRQLTWPHGADLATKLWDSAEDLYRTDGFVPSTGLKI